MQGTAGSGCKEIVETVHEQFGDWEITFLALPSSVDLNKSLRTQWLARKILMKKQRPPSHEEAINELPQGPLWLER